MASRAVYIGTVGRKFFVMRRGPLTASSEVLICHENCVLNFRLTPKEVRRLINVLEHSIRKPRKNSKRVKPRAKEDIPQTYEERFGPNYG